MDEKVRATLQQFDIPGTIQEISTWVKGHIHDTFIGSWNNNGVRKRFLHQILNTAVFKKVDVVMNNTILVTQHIQKKLDQSGDRSFKTVRFIPTKEGRWWYTDQDDRVWRTMEFIEGTESYDCCNSKDIAYEAGKAVGWFQENLIDLSPTSLPESIYKFQNSEYRYEQFDLAVKNDPKGRVSEVSEEIEFALSNKKLASVFQSRLLDGTIHYRATHADTKLNNVLFLSSTGKAVSVVDLDTCMAGYSLYDLGDLARCVTVSAAEDERDLGKVKVDMELMDSTIEGYLLHAKNFLNPIELDLLPIAPRLLALTLGVRFLTDHINGDQYFKIHREGQNLDRARTQLKIAQEMERYSEQIAEKVRRYSN